MRGWLSYMARSRSTDEQVATYKRLERQLANYQRMNVISFESRSGLMFEELRKTYPRLGTMDLKIAAIAIVHEATLLTRNFKDFGQIQGLQIEDWTF